MPVADGLPPDPKEKRMSDFFDQLQVFSERVLPGLGVPKSTDYPWTESPWTYGTFTGGGPTGATLHFTAGPTLGRAVRWFMDPKHKSKASAQVVVDRGWPNGMREQAEDLPLIYNLPTMVVQCLPPDMTAWHAGKKWFNQRHYGVEIVNPGELRMHGTGWAYWPEDWTTPYQPQIEPVAMCDKWWEPYPVDQLLTVVRVLREVQALRPEPWRQVEILGHEQIKENKNDPGPLFPLHDIRRALREAIDPKLYQWVNHYSNDSRYQEFVRDGIVMAWGQEVLKRPTYDVKVLWGDFMTNLTIGLLKAGTDFAPLGKAALAVLGYEVSDVTQARMTSDDVASVEMFQRMADLSVDGDPGPKTREAIVNRILDRGYGS